MDGQEDLDADAVNSAALKPRIASEEDTAVRPANKHPLVGTIFADNYQIESFLGSGGMSSVLKARHLNSDKVVAIKLLHPRMLHTGNYLQRFLQEAKAAAVLNHSNLVAVSDFGESANGQPYLVMDYVKGISLAKKLKSRKKLTVSETIEICQEILQALAHVHECGIVHRDLKPSNIMLETIGEGKEKVRLVDFGLAKMLPEKDGQESLTKAGELVGSPVYMSPEYCIWGTCDQRTDIYALGCVMYECLTAEPPFDGKTPLVILTKHMNEPVPPFPEGLNIPQWLQAVIFKALAKDPKERIQSARDFSKALTDGQAQL
jgi:serine/threonine-protein kinase